MIIRRMWNRPGWSPAYRQLGDIRREMDRVLQSLAGDAGLRAAGVYPAINVTQDDDATYVRAELPGIHAEDLEITVKDQTLTVSGERKIGGESETASYHRREREGGHFSRSFELPVPVEAAKVEARYVDGILTVRLPKTQAAKPRQITVAAG